MLRLFGFTLFLLGAASTALHFTDYEFESLSWIDHWSETDAWGVRGMLLLIGVGLLFFDWINDNKDKKDRKHKDDEQACDGRLYLFGAPVDGDGGSVDSGFDT